MIPELRLCQPHPDAEFSNLNLAKPEPNTEQAWAELCQAQSNLNISFFVVFVSFVWLGSEGFFGLVIFF